ncbi:MAG: response regulator, partial [Clostridia bacterium]|nr:response regulator [Clostridia bacterium]
MVNILVVDDDKNTRKLIRAVLERENYTVFTENDGEAALARLDAVHIDLIVLDVMMPKLDGYGFTETLR